MSLNEQIIAMQCAWYWPFGALLVLLLAAYGVGHGCLGRIAVPARWRAAAELLYLTIGLDLLTLLFRLGDRAVIALSAGWLWAAAGVPAAWGVLRLFRLMPECWKRAWPLWTVIALFGLWTVGSALLAPYAWDEQSYQVTLPWLYLQSGGSGVHLDNPYSAFPSAPHFLMLAGMKLGGLNFARLLIWASYLLIFGWFWVLLRRFGGWTAAILTAAFLLSPVAEAMQREVYQEPFLLLNLLAGVAALGVCRTQLGVAAAVAGFAAGMAAAVKLTGGGVSLAVAGAFFCVLANARQGRAVNTRLVLLFGFAAVVALLPFYWRAFAATGNFFYPFGAALADPASPAASVEAYHSLLGTSRYGLAGIPGIFTSWLLSAYDWKIFDGIVMGWQFPLLIVSGVVCWYLAARRNVQFLPFLWSFGGGLAFYLFWSLSSQQTRFLLPFYFCAAFFAASGMAFLGKRLRGALLGGVLIATLASMDGQAFSHYFLAWRSLETSRNTPAEFVGFAGRDPAFMKMLDYIAGNTPADAKLLVLYDRRGLYMPRKYVLGTPYFQEAYLTPVPETPEAVLDVLRSGGFDYILMVAGGPSPRNPDPLPEFELRNDQLTALLVLLLEKGELRYLPVPETDPYRLLKVNASGCILPSETRETH